VAEATIDVSIKLLQFGSVSCTSDANATCATQDNSVVALHSAKMEDLGLFRGDTVLLTASFAGQPRKQSVAIVLGDNTCEAPKIRLNLTMRKNLCVDCGGSVMIFLATDIKYGKHIHVQPIDDTVEGISGNLVDIFLKPYFVEAYRPVSKGDIFTCQGAGRQAKFKVTECDPEPHCIVAPGTAIHCDSCNEPRESEALGKVILCAVVAMVAVLWMWL
jgi:transitional endoplasmic reticulum ATPase